MTKIPADIECRIPSYFYYAFAGELCSIFGPTIFQKEENDIYEIFYTEGSIGWVQALKATCRKLNMQWLWYYYTELTIHDSDTFDDQIEEKIVSEVIETKVESNSYYQFLLENNKKLI